LNWGVSLPNPRLRDEVRTQHLFLPFPLNAFHHRRRNNTGAWIHLSDGGQSENTGVWSLVRRGVRTIIVSDHAEDRDGRFEDMCTLQRKLAVHRLYLHMPELQDFGKVCKIGSELHYDLWAWPARIVRGCITSSASDTNCADGSASYFARLFLLKPALDMTVLRNFTTCNLAPAADKAERGLPQCTRSLQKLRRCPGYKDFPTELFGFLAANRKGSKGTHLRFPQNSTTGMTLNSSAWIFGAYRELARWQAAELDKEIQRPIEPLGVRVHTAANSPLPDLAPGPDQYCPGDPRRMNSGDYKSAN